jgi:7-cyano-7-deazaguanine synthase
MARALSNGLDHFTSIIAPILMASKADIIKIGQELDVPFQYTWSCYEGLRRACGKCASCKIRLAGFEEAGLVDPVLYEG